MYIKNKKIIIILLTFYITLFFNQKSFSKNNIIYKNIKKYKKISKKFKKKNYINSERIFLDGEKLLILKKTRSSFKKFKSLLKKMPLNNAIHYKLGIMTLRYPQLKGKKKILPLHFNISIKLFPYHKNCYLAAAEFYVNKHEYKKASKAYNNMFAIFMPTYNEIMTFANFYLYQDKYLKTMEIYEIIKNYYHNEEIFFLKQNLFFLKKKNIENIKIWEKKRNVYNQNIFSLNFFEILIQNKLHNLIIKYLKYYKNNKKAAIIYMLNLNFKNSKYYIYKIINQRNKKINTKIKIIKLYIKKIKNRIEIKNLKDIIKILILKNKKKKKLYYMLKKIF